MSNTGTINVYPSKLPGEPIERHVVTKRQSVRAWLVGNVDGFRDTDSPPISVHVNGELVPHTRWAEVEFGVGDTVGIYPEPKGLEVIAFATFAAVAAFQAVIGLLQPSLPKTGQGHPGQGDPLNQASVKGNKIKINAPIREAFGKNKIYPDYLIPNHRYFQDKRDQVVDTHLSIGVGEFDVPAGRVLIGDTSMIALGADAEFQIYGPGADVSGDERCHWWHTAAEIGATSNGTAGLELTVTTAADPSPGALQYVFSGDTVTIPSGAGEFPANWESGMLVRIVARYPYTVTDGVGVGVRDVISGDIAQLGLAPGDTIEIAGDNAGEYIVDTVDNMAGTLTLDYSNGDPAAALVTGSLRMSIGFRGLLYRIVGVTPSTVTLERLLSDGSTDTGWPGFSDITLDDATLTLDSSTAEGGWLGPFAACPDGEVTDLIEWDFFFPGGLVKIGAKDGGRYDQSVTVERQWRRLGSLDPWQSVVKTYTDNTLNQIGFTERDSLSGMYQPECRVRRIGEDSQSARRQDTVQWYGLKSRLQAPSSYDGVTTMAVRVQGGGKIAAQTEQQISVEATRKLPSLVGGAWTAPVATRDIIPAMAYIAKSLGYQDSDLDLVEMERLDGVWRARGDQFNGRFEKITTAKEAMNQVLRAGFAEFTIDRARLRPVRDEPRTQLEHMYTPQNCTEVLSRDFSAIGPDDFDGVDVEYTDGTSWQVETVECRLPGDIGQRVEKIQAEGVTSRTQAWRIGMRARRAHAFRRYQYSTATELDALNSRYMSYVSLGDDVPGYGKSALLLSFEQRLDSVVLESSEPLPWVPGADHVVAVRRQDGSLDGPHPATRIDDYRLSVPALGFVPDVSWSVEPPHLQFGTVERWNYPALITEISPTADGQARITAINYDARVYADDDNSP